MMITLAEALQTIRAHSQQLPADRVPLAQASGLILRESVTADRDFPPFNRVMMDGIAMASESLGSGVSWTVQAHQAAGQAPLTLENSQHAIVIATGAVLPEGCDTVIPNELYDITDDCVVLHADALVEPKQFVHKQASDRKQGDVLIEEGTILGAKEIGVCATCGVSQVLVSRRPKVAIAATGDELVDVDSSPKPWELRRSNDLVIQSFVESYGAELVRTVSLPDDFEQTHSVLEALLWEVDVLITSGGVSKGEKDYVRPALENLGADILFHRVQQRPGFPFLFAKVPDKAIVFGLPGNPLAVLSVLHRCVGESLSALQGRQYVLVESELQQPFRCKGTDVYYIPAMVTQSESGLPKVSPVRVQNSGDIAGVLGTDGFICLDGSAKKEYIAGDSVPFVAWR